MRKCLHPIRSCGRRHDQRRGQMYLTLIVLLGIIPGITMAWYYTLKMGKQGNIRMIGQDQLKLIEAYNSAEEDLYALDLAASVITPLAYQDALDMASGCGPYGTYPVWAIGDEECIPTEEMIADDFEDSFRSRFGLILQPFAGMPMEIDLVKQNESYLVTGRAQSHYEYLLDGFGGEAR